MSSSSFEANPVEYLLLLGERNRAAYQVQLGCSDTYRQPDVVMFKNDREALLNMDAACQQMAESKMDCNLIYPDPMFGPRVVSLYSNPNCHTLWIFFQDESAAETYNVVALRHFRPVKRQLRNTEQEGERQESIQQANIRFYSPSSPRRRKRIANATPPPPAVHKPAYIPRE